jgi:RimJ/RimL family protein N-acetyltransferase
LLKPATKPALGNGARGGAVTKINLRVRSDNVRAIALYERKGFEREGLLRRGMRVDDVYYDLLAMGLCL